MRRRRSLPLTVYVVGSIVTLGLAWALWEAHHRAAAAALVVASPFPCPPGLPC